MGLIHDGAGSAMAADIEAFQRTLDRAAFVPAPYKGLAGDDHPLPIGHEQTISQPSLVTLMTRLLLVAPTHRVLEIGTGSGYQTAILAHFAREVCTVERIPELLTQARERLEGLGMDNIRYRLGDGTKGWHEEAPFHRILVTAAAARIPPDLLRQLAPEGILVIPVGDPFLQDLLVVRKDRVGQIRTQRIAPVRFVELVGDAGWDRD